MDKKKRPVVLAQLRRIYDGHFTREFGTDEGEGEHSWKGRISTRRGHTRNRQALFSTFSPWGSASFGRDGRELGVLTLAFVRCVNRQVLQNSSDSRFIDCFRPILAQPNIPAPKLDLSQESRIAHLTEIVALARAYVPAPARIMSCVPNPLRRGIRVCRSN